MRRRRVLILSVLAFAGILAATAVAEMMSVQVREGPLRKSPSFMGQVVATLAYGERVNVLEKRPGWIKVSAGAGSGWMHESALTPKRIVMGAGGTNVQTGASSEELALAGKGFNSDIEAEFKSQNQDLNYAAVDRMEKRNVPTAEIAMFLKEGAVKADTGGAQ